MTPVTSWLLQMLLAWASTCECFYQNIWPPMNFMLFHFSRGLLVILIFDSFIATQEHLPVVTNVRNIVVWNFRKIDIEVAAKWKIIKKLIFHPHCPLPPSRSIKRIIFNSLVKPNVNEKGEKQMETISTSQALQIAGRAGRSVCCFFRCRWSSSVFVLWCHFLLLQVFLQV